MIGSPRVAVSTDCRSTKEEGGIGRDGRVRTKKMEG